MRAYRRCLLGLIAGFALAGLGLSQAPAQQTGATEVICNKQFIVSAGATATTIGVAAVSGVAINVCGYTFNAGAAAATVQLIAGTGAACGTNTINITPVFSLGINGSLSFAPGRAFISTPAPLPPAAAYALCYVITGTGPMAIAVQYLQQ